MADTSDRVETDTDVLVIGGGLAAAFAAIKARESGARVTLVDKSFFGRSGCSAVASGIMRAFFPGDNLDQWVANSGGGKTTRPFVDEKLLRKVTLLSGQLIREMDEWGVRWITDGSDFRRVGSVDVGEGLANVMMDGGGPAMMMAVRAAALHRNVRVFNRVLVNDLLTEGGVMGAPVVGAIGIHSRTGHVYVFRCRTVVMATGPLMVPFHQRDGAGRGRGMPIDLAGDGHAAMLRAGTIMGKLELGSAAIVPWGFYCAPGLEPLLAIGGRDIFVNAEGDRFLVGNDVNRDMRARSALGLSFLRELREGRGPVYLDIRHLDFNQRRLLRQVIPIVLSNFESAGFDITRDRIPYSIIVMATHSVGGGGATLNERMATSIPHLYAAGNCTDGAYMSMQQNLTDCAAMGYWAGIHAAQEALSITASSPDAAQIKALSHALSAPLRQSSGTSYAAAKERIQALYSEKFGMTLDARRGEEILSVLDLVIEEELPRAKASDVRDACRLHSLSNFVQVLKAVLTVIIHRTESRGNVVRDDYPMVDNERWLKYTRLRKEADGSLVVWDEPVARHIAVAERLTRHSFFASAHA